MFRSSLFIISLALASCSSPGTRSHRNSFSAPKLPPTGGSPNIFKTYSPTADSVMMEGWARNFDMSGVSFDNRKTATLVTRRHVVMAQHYQRGISSKVIFHSRNGEHLERTLMAVRNVYGDVAVGLLDQEVPNGYKVYALPTPKEDYSHLTAKTAILTDQNRRLFFHEVAMVNPGAMSFRYENPSRHGWSKRLVKGDSGNPSFMISGSDLVLVETHSTGGGGAGPFYGSPKLQERLQEEITKLSPGYKFRTKNL